MEPRKKAVDVSIKWLEMRRKLPKNQQLFLEIITFAFMALNSENSHIEIEKSTKQTLKNDESVKTDITYTMTVEGEEG
ncbi:hypothetical protein ACWOE3_13055 [Enterococcus dispar]|uniref:Uncharacterized protein n=1 Tax=Enterococcus dispar ATCC 51266 TaxID=1139219 RepID=S0KDL2_9ENTE|nr:hypothetical protein [Enterococcus dispar]EOT42772.1 hypothetical protein OMK_01133 [Enterococcus dispar ATCC 51266]EOW84777.1 hypothetical protein I569_00066 [Enterococcus dispar ATCC 51266]